MEAGSESNEHLASIYYGKGMYKVLGGQMKKAEELVSW